MKRQISYIGGFASTNSGSIQNCYSLVDVGNKNRIVGGFVGQNTGRVETCFCDTKVKGLTGGFVGDGDGNIEDCYFFHTDDPSSNQINQLWDNKRAICKSEISSEKKIERLRFDLDEIWEYQGGTPLIRFKSDSWMSDTDSIFQEVSPEEIITINTADELIEFAKHVNGGYTSYRQSRVQLGSNIDLGGREWIPIGNVEQRVFAGVFDGCGYTVSNFKITDETQQYKGFFGINSGRIFNVSVDCIIRGGGCIGGLVARNDSGMIGCCSAIVSIEQKSNKNEKKSENLSIGGLVGQNRGTIYESYAAGRVTFAAVVLIWPFIGVGTGVAVLVAAIIIVINIPSVVPTIAPIFNKIPEDLKQTQIDEDETVTPRTDSNFVSFQFDKEIKIDLDAGTCTLDYKNPGDSNHNTVVELQITDAVAKESMGGTGRDAALQSEYEAREDYDPEAFRVTIGASDSVSPGYQVAALSLSDYAKQNMAPGTYDAVIMIYPYDMQTNNKAMLESQLPVTIVVQ